MNPSCLFKIKIYFYGLELDSGLKFPSCPQIRLIQIEVKGSLPSPQMNPSPASALLTQ